MSWETIKADLKLNTFVSLPQEEIEIMFPKLSKGFHSGDPAYNTTTKSEVRKALKYWVFRFVAWTKRKDCDNFSDLFMGICKWIYPTQAIGTVWVERENDKHALNFFIWYDEIQKGFGWSYIEPQTGEIFDLLDGKVRNWRPYYVRI